MEIFQLSKSKILQRTTTFDILNHFLRPFHSKLKLRQGQHISNPLILPQKQETPSFNIYYSRRSREWRYKDFASNDEGSPFDLVMNLNKCSFSEALTIINREMKLGIRGGNISRPKTFKPQAEEKRKVNLEKPKTTEYSILSNSLMPNFLSYWHKFGVKREMLQKFDVLSIKQYTALSKLGKPYTVRASDSQPIIAYKIGMMAHKLYFPNAKKYRFLYLGRKQQSYCFGYDQLPEKGELVIITGGEKDVLTLAGLGLAAISLNSETALPEENLIHDLKSRFRKVVVLYDLDETGMIRSSALASSFGMNCAILPPMNTLKGHKDISDYIAYQYPRKPLKDLILEMYK